MGKREPTPDEIRDILEGIVKALAASMMANKAGIDAISAMTKFMASSKVPNPGVALAAKIIGAPTTMNMAILQGESALKRVKGFDA